MSNEKVSYGAYLRIPELLGLQRLVSEPAEHDEMLFIVVHQVHELWFKQMLHELDAVRAALDGGRVLPALRSLKRVTAIQRVLIEQIDVLETMTPLEFNTFRNLLRPASGFQSTQFREIEFLSGGGNPAVLAHMESDPGMARVEKRLGEPTLYDAFLRLLARRGFDIPKDIVESNGHQRREVDAHVVAAFKAIYERSAENPGFYELYMLCESFVDYDELFLLWRTRHVRMVERTIGAKMGTGGSEGAAYLERTLGRKFFPELWAVRSELGR